MLLRERLEADVERRQSQLQAALQDIDSKQLQINAAQRSISTLEESLAQARTRYDESQQNVERLQQTISEQRVTLQEAQQQNQDVERRYLGLAGDFDEASAVAAGSHAIGSVASGANNNPDSNTTHQPS